jgi:nucleotide-binding universal stress UspA family protein
MFKHILVPLDGSRRAEQAIPVAAALARASHGSILLLRVVETGNLAGFASLQAPGPVPDVLGEKLSDATTSLDEVTQTLAEAGIETHRVVLSGQAAPQILEMARLLPIELIVLCSHGSAGFKRWMVGSVAQKIVRASPLPVLLLPEQRNRLDGRATYPLRALIPLDGSLAAEAALLPAAQVIAAASSGGEGELSLLRVVDVPAHQGGARNHLDAEIRFRQREIQRAETYLQRIQTRLTPELASTPHVRVTWSVEEGKDIASLILRSAETANGMGRRKMSDLIALASTGQGSSQGWMFGSVAERLLSTMAFPLLIVHPQSAASLPVSEKAEPTLRRDGAHPARAGENKEDIDVYTSTCSV